ncbi:MAG: hypothetical protein AAFW69_03790, partial [Pseudomonadota bacterium]
MRPHEHVQTGPDGRAWMVGAEGPGGRVVVQVKPRLILRLGITGHRPNRIDPAASAAISDRIAEVTEALAGALDRLGAAHAWAWDAEPPELRLATALAEGADTLAAEAVLEQGHRLDVILPMPREEYEAEQAFDTAATARFAALLEHPARHGLMELGAPEVGGQAPGERYLQGGRMMLAHTDLLLAVWDGQPANGAGGTAQVLAEALDRGIPVIWIDLDGVARLLPTPGALRLRDEAAELSDAVIAAILDELLAPPSEAGARARLQRFYDEPERQAASWTAWSLLMRVFAGRPKSSGGGGGGSGWDRFRATAERVGGPHFAEALGAGLEARWARADAIAIYTSAAYRSTFVVNFLLAACAVLAGLSSVLWWTHPDAVLIKAGWVTLEITIILVILWLTARGAPSRQDWHRRWLEARMLAEALRLARLTALVGGVGRPGRDDPGHRRDDWPGWYARAALSEIGPPSGRVDAAVLEEVIDAVLAEEVEPQIAYNRKTEHTYHKVDHGLHITGERLFIATLIVGLCFVIFAGLYTAASEVKALAPVKSVKATVKSLVTLLGAGMPALAAALAGIRAIGDFKLTADRAERTGDALEALRARLLAEREKPSQPGVARLITETTATVGGDLNAWEQVYRQR